MLYFREIGNLFKANSFAFICMGFTALQETQSKVSEKYKIDNTREEYDSNLQPSVWQTDVLPEWAKPYKFLLQYK